MDQQRYVRSLRNPTLITFPFFSPDARGISGPERKVISLRFLSAVILILALLPSVARADEGRISGCMFGDYYWVVSADDADAGMPRKQNAFQLRRIYFTYDKEVAEDFDIQFRLEANDKGFGKGDKMIPFVKTGYLKWKKGVAGSDLYIGLSGTPTWSISEKVWGYRSIEKTIMDLNKIGSSADIGVGLKGKSGKLGYYLMVGNGPGQKPENDNGKKFYGQVSFKASEALQLVGYADVNMQPQDQNEFTVKGFAAFQQERFSAGLEGFMRVNKKAAGDEDVTLTGMSAFGSLELSGNVKGFGRVDMLGNDATDTTDLLLIAGVDRELDKNIHLMPNLYVQLPDGPDPNIQARLTFYYIY